MLNFPYEEIIAHCKVESPKEACGLVILFKGRYKYVPCTNVASEECHFDEFAISPSDFANAEDIGEIVTVVHSHPKRDSSAGPTDIVSQKKHGIDWLIVGLNSGESVDLSWLKDEKENLPLYGRTYTWHVNDCGSFIRDFYKQEFDIDVPDFYRPEKFWEKGLEVYLEAYEKAGFHEIDMVDLEYGDVILFALGSSITTHGAVYIGDNKIAHHLLGRLSCRDVLGKYYLDRATRYLRHKDMAHVKNS